MKRIALGLLALTSTGLYSAPSAGIPASATSWQCHVRCYRGGGTGGSTWLSKKNDKMVLCADFPDIQSAIDIQCRALYGGGSDDSAIHGYLNWPASPGTLAACKNIGSKCTAGKPYRTVWECGLSCTGGGRDYPARGSVCAISQRSAYQTALHAYRTDGPRPVCRAGYQLSREVGTLEFGDPGESMCRNTEKECEPRTADGL